MNHIKRERWTEEEIDSLPYGEHNYFERKSGALFDNNSMLFGKLAKTLSAIANSGGGHIILGVQDDGTPDGVPKMKGRTPLREWLEQKIPSLVTYPLSDFRVHVVERSATSRIPSDKDVIVIDIGDSSLAPHQCARDEEGVIRNMYYHRQGGKSEPAPHFYVELLRQRLVSPILKVTKFRVNPYNATQIDEKVFLAIQLHFEIENIGRVVAHRWELVLLSVDGINDNEHYHFNQHNFPSNINRIEKGIPLDRAILPSSKRTESIEWGVFLTPSELVSKLIHSEIEQKILPLVFSYRIATETSPGEVEGIELRTIVNSQALNEFICKCLLK